MNENNFWLGAFSIIAFTIITSVFLATNFYLERNRIVAEMVKTGVSPIAALCAVNDDYGKYPTCIIYVTREVF